MNKVNLVDGTAISLSNGGQSSEAHKIGKPNPTPADFEGNSNVIEFICPSQLRRIERPNRVSLTAGLQRQGKK